MAENITRCPKCNTSFRITDAHLKSAKGSVRCGSCLTIFNAIDHLAIVEQSLEVETASVQDDGISDDMLISDDMGLEAEEELFSEEFNETVDTPRSNTGEFSLFERDPIKDDDEEDAEVDDSWALGLIEDGHDEHPAADEDALDESDGRLEQVFNEEVEPQTQDLPDQDMDYESFYGTDKFQIIDDEPEEIEAELPAGYHDTYSAPHEEDFHQDYDSQDAVNSQLSAQFLDSIEPEPVEFTWKPSGQWWHSKVLWLSLSFIALIGLGGQIAWHQKNTWSLNPQLRPYYEMACQYVNCQLPVQQDVSKISARNLIVRPNPKLDNSLVIDFILQNSADFQQSFPAIELAFTDHREDVIAARCFSPGDYLGGELSGQKIMPVRQPIHIALEIRHPGESATGYKIGICP